MRPLILAAAVSLLCGTAALAENTPDPGSRTAIQATISQQLDAFRAGDGVTAESFASPSIRDRFPDPAGFMAMVRQAYGALVKPRSSHFGSLDQTPLGLVQKLSVVDSNGQTWTAAYVMTLVDGVWRISGCYMLKEDAISA